MHKFNDSVDKNIVDVRKKRNASSSAVRDFRTRLASVGSGHFAYEIDLLKGFARNHVNAGFAMPLFVVLVGMVTSSWIGWMIAVFWIALASLSHLLLSLLSRRFLSRERTQDDLPKWRRNFLFAQILIAIAWSFFAAIDCSSCNDAQYSVIQFSTILVFQAVATMLTYSYGRSILIMAAPPSLVLSVRFIQTYDPAIIIMGAILVAAILFFYLIAERFKRSVITMLEHHTEKETLIVELETEKAFSEEARNRAEEANLAKSRFLATMSHELRTPLNAILGFSEIIRDEVMGPVGNENYKEYVSDIHNSGSHLLKLINEILDISRIEAGKHELNEEPVQLVSVVEEACHMMQIKARQKGVEMKTAFEHDLPDVWLDERAVHQITLNLISNALKFTPAGGEILVKVGWTAKGGQYLAVKDTGPGIPEEEIPLVLSSFGQGTIAIKHAEQGTGLGLTIVQALIHMHQGSFDLNSELRKGTEAIAYFPKQRVLGKDGRPNKNAETQVA